MLRLSQLIRLPFLEDVQLVRELVLMVLWLLIVVAQNIRQLSEAHRKLQHASRVQLAEQCPAHNTPYYYYCHNCKEAACPDCVTMDGKHRDHSLAHLRALFAANQQQLQAVIHNADARRQSLLDKVQHAERCAARLRESRDDAISELHETTELAVQALQMDYSKRHTRLHEYATRHASRAASLLQTINDQQRSLSRLPVLQVVASLPTLTKELEQKVRYRL